LFYQCRRAATNHRWRYGIAECDLHDSVLSRVA
jgi:hypothetical protein